MRNCKYDTNNNLIYEKEIDGNKWSESEYEYDINGKLVYKKTNYSGDSCHEVKFDSEEVIVYTKTTYFIESSVYWEEREYKWEKGKLINRKDTYDDGDWDEVEYKWEEGKLIYRKDTHADGKWTEIEYDYDSEPNEILIKEIKSDDSIRYLRFSPDEFYPLIKNLYSDAYKHK